MKIESIVIGDIPALVWGNKSDKVYLFVHGKMGSKNSAGQLASIITLRGYQVLSFDLPEHGDRTDFDHKCNVINGVSDLQEVAQYVFAHWNHVSLYGCSLGAYFSLQAYSKLEFENCLFHSPILDMRYLILQMFDWFNITEQELEEKKEIKTPIDTMSWEYYLYVLNHPTDYWPIKTHILFGGKDNLQSQNVVESFTKKHKCFLTTSKESEHSFMSQDDQRIVSAWITDSF